MAGHHWSVRARFALFTGAVAALLSTLLGTVLIASIHRLATDRLTDDIGAAAGRVSSAIARDAVPPDPLPYDLIRDLQVVGPGGTVTASTPRLRGLPRMASFTPSGGRTSEHSVVCGGVFPKGACDIVVAQRVYRAGEPWIVYGAAPAPPLAAQTRQMVMVAIGIVVLTGLTMLGSYRVVKGSLGPVDAIRGELDEISATCPGRRVPVPSSHDEIHCLALSVNGTLDRLQGAMERQRRFASDASHDLRSPITAMRAEVEGALMAPEQTDVSLMGDSLLVSLDRLQGIVSDLLMVARLDSGAQGALEPVNLSKLVEFELDRRHSGLDVKREVEPGVGVTGDLLRLARLLTNLMDNAERHAESAVTVTVRAEPGGPRFPAGRAVLEVADDGEGIAPGNREAVFQRFTRLDAARRKDAGGTGLGLPIARQIAEISGGTLTIEPSEQGARFVLRLPLCPEPDEDDDPGDDHQDG